MNKIDLFPFYEEQIELYEQRVAERRIAMFELAFSELDYIDDSEDNCSSSKYKKGDVQ